MERLVSPPFERNQRHDHVPNCWPINVPVTPKCSRSLVACTTQTLCNATWPPVMIPYRTATTQSPASELTPNHENRTTEDPKVVRNMTLYRPMRSARATSGTWTHQELAKRYPRRGDSLPAPIRPIALAALQAINTYGPSLIHPFWIAYVPQKYRKKK